MKLLELIKAAIARLAELSADELTELKGNIIKCAEEFDGDTPVLVELGGYADQVVERAATLKSEEEQSAQEAQAARDRIKILNSDDEAETPEGDEVPEEGADEIEATLEPIAASAKKALRSSPSKMKRGGTTRSPELSNADTPRPTLVAAGQLVEHTFGDEFEDKFSLASEMCHVLDGLDPRGRNGRVLIARAKWGDLYPEERRLSGESTMADFRKIDAVCGLTNKRKSMTASGGVPLPTNVDYSMDVWATADRPVRDGLAAFHVDRGGLVYRQPPTLADLNGATAVWTNANDIDPTDPTTKPVLTVTALDTTQVYISAIPTRLQFGNLMGQFDPETIAAYTDLAIANAARVAELNLLTNIQEFATVTVTSAEALGASRDLFTTITQTAAAYRHTNRLNRDQNLTAIFPSWGLDLIKQDRVMEIAHDDSGTNVFAISDEEVESWFKAQNINVIWSLDGLAADAGFGTYANQYFAAFTSAVVPAYPVNVLWNLFIEGSIQFLDGGRLDLGVVRDSTLDATNDYETFVEPFENVANRSFSGGVLQVVSTTHPRGSTSATSTIS